MLKLGYVFVQEYYRPQLCLPLEAKYQPLMGLRWCLMSGILKYHIRL